MPSQPQPTPSLPCLQPASKQTNKECIPSSSHCPVQSPTQHNNSHTHTDPDGKVDLSTCGVACTAGAVIYGVNESDQKTLDDFKISALIIAMFIIGFVILNQYIDQKQTKESLAKKPLISHCPFCISAALFDMLSSSSLLLSVPHASLSLPQPCTSQNKAPANPSNR